MPISDVFIAKRIQCETIQWILFDAYKFKFGYDINIIEHGLIQEKKTDNNTCDSINLKVHGDFSLRRRSNLNGIVLTCGLVVSVLIFSFSSFSLSNIIPLY